tara:strand:- start:43 stop:237 length:195 start_codon:yes stop_codon:yes gene_type:complete
MFLYGFRLENDISADGIKRRRLGKPIAFLYGFRTGLEPPHFVIEPFISQSLFVKGDLLLGCLLT